MKGLLKILSILDFKLKFGDLNTIFHWRNSTIDQATETAVYLTRLTGLKVQKASEKPLSLLKDPPRPPSKANTGNPNDNWAILDKAKKIWTLLDFKLKVGDLNTIFHWRNSTIDQATETAVYFTGLTEMKVQKASEKPL